MASMSSPTSSSDEMLAKGPARGKSAKQPAMGKTLLTVVLGTWIGLGSAGGVLYYVMKSGRLPLKASASAQEAKATRSITLEPILANLADAGGHAYVRLGLRLEIADDSAAVGGDAAVAPDPGGESKREGKSSASGDGKGLSELDSSIRDTVLAVLGRQSSAELLGPDGKEHLKIELTDAIERGAVRVDVKDIFFTDFLVQQ
jgi:flagellar FliL protein